MLFTPSSPPSSVSEPSSVGNESSPTHTSSARYARYGDSRPPAISSATNATLVSNGLGNNRFLSASQSPLPLSSDQEWFYSPLSSSSSSRPSVQVTPTKSKSNLHSPSKSRRRDSCPTAPIQKKIHRFRFPHHLKPFTRHACRTETPSTHSNVHHLEDIYYSPSTTLSTNLRPLSMPMPVANPIAAAALVDDDETLIAEDQTRKSLTPSPSLTPKNSGQMHRSATDCSTNIYQSSSRKLILNVGGVRHEGKLI